MKFPKTSQDIENEIFISSDTQGELRLRQLIFILEKVDPELIVEGVIKVFENQNRQEMLFRDQEFAGRILHELKPKTEKEIVEILQRTLKNWNKSVEQFPFWLRDNYGIDRIKEALGQIKFTDIEQDKADTIRWWLQIKANA